MYIWRIPCCGSYQYISESKYSSSRRKKHSKSQRMITYPFYLSLASCFSPIPGSHSSSTPLLSHLEFLSTPILCLPPSLVQASIQKTTTTTWLLIGVSSDQVSYKLLYFYRLASPNLVSLCRESILIESILSIIGIGNPINFV